MIPSRKLAAMFACVFVLGGMVGALLEWNLVDNKLSQFLSHTGDPASFAQRLDKKLATQYQLDADEQARIAPLTQEMAQKLYQLRRKFASDVLATLDEEHTRIAAQMTETQRAAYERDIAERRKRLEAVITPAASPGSQP